MHQVPSDPRQVVIMADFDSMSPEALFDYLTRADLIVKWWPKEAESDPREGGAFLYRWPDNGWTLRGKFTKVVPGEHLAFTWAWDHEPGREDEQLVNIWFDRFLSSGTRLGIFHGDFPAGPESDAARQGVAEGWIHFLMILAGLSDGNATE